MRLFYVNSQITSSVVLIEWEIWEIGADESEQYAVIVLQQNHTQRRDFRKFNVRI